MSAQDHLNPTQFYHGSPASLSPGDEVNTAHSNDYGQGKYNYFTKNKSEAETYSSPARRDDYSDSSEPGHVYVVEPTGTYSSDPMSGGHRSRLPLTVVGEA